MPPPSETFSFNPELHTCCHFLSSCFQSSTLPASFLDGRESLISPRRYSAIPHQLPQFCTCLTPTFHLARDWTHCFESTFFILEFISEAWRFISVSLFSYKGPSPCTLHIRRLLHRPCRFFCLLACMPSIEFPSPRNPSRSLESPFPMDAYRGCLAPPVLPK